MTNEEILRLYDTLERLGSNHELKFNVCIGYLFAKNKASIRPDVQLIKQERQKILCEYGTIQDNGDIIIPKEYIEETQKKLKQLMEIEVEIPINQIPIDEFEGINLNLEDIEGLKPLIMDFQISLTSEPIYNN